MAANKDEVLDVAVVGAGMGGLYSAWRLLTQAGSGTGADETRGAGTAPLRITVFEGSNRVGGRLLSLTPPGMPATRCELGGMRYMSRHVLVSALVDHYQLRTEPMPVYKDENIAYLRGKPLRLADLSLPDKIPYNLRPMEKSTLASNLLISALSQIVPNCLKLATMDFPALQKEMQKAAFDGVPLHKLGFWNLLARVLSPDALAFVRDSGGYDCLVSNWSAADAIPFILADFAPGVVYSRFPDGYEQLPQKLAADVQAAGGNVELGACLKGFDMKGGEVELEFTDGRVVRARKLVLAMPRRSLELLEARGPVLDKANRHVRHLIESVEPIPLFKIFVCYPYPWWEAANVQTGRSLTDMPVRQCYYWDSYEDGNSALLASYDDDLSVTFWAGLRSRHADDRAWPPARDKNENSWSSYKAPEALTDEIHRQLVEMHGVRYAPRPYAVAYRDWAEDPYGGGVNFWRIHAKSWEVVPAIVNPVPNVPVYVCGEAYSHEQGWVEGALQTAELMLTSHFGLTPYLAPARSTRTRSAGGQA